MLRTTAANNTHLWCHTLSHPFVILGHVFPRALVVGIVITSNCSIISSYIINMGLGLFVRTRCRRDRPPRRRGAWIPFWEDEMR